MLVSHVSVSVCLTSDHRSRKVVTTAQDTQAQKNTWPMQTFHWLFSESNLLALVFFFFIHRHCLKKEKNLKKWPFPSRRAWNEWSRRVHPRRVIWTRFNCHRFLLLLSQPFLKNNQTMANYESTERKFPKWLSFHSSPPPAPPQRKKKCLNIYSTKQLMMMGNDDGVGAFQSRWAAWVMRTTLNPHFSLFLSNLHFFF